MGSVSSRLYVCIITVRITYGTNIRLYMRTHTSHQHISIRYDDTFYEECVSVILYCFMLFYVVRFKLYIALLRMSVFTRNW
jgi:hypothetical protein